MPILRMRLAFEECIHVVLLFSLGKLSISLVRSLYFNAVPFAGIWSWWFRKDDSGESALVFLLSFLFHGSSGWRAVAVWRRGSWCLAQYLGD